MAFTGDLDTHVEETSQALTRLPKVITLCGSTRYLDEFHRQNERLTLEGHIVISVALQTSSRSNRVTEETKKMLDQLHLQKIRLSDEILVINCDEYIGESTRKEIEFAERIGRKVSYLIPMRAAQH